jgi:hypothetical protein
LREGTPKVYDVVDNYIPQLKSFTQQFAPISGILPSIKKEDDLILFNYY